MTSFGTGSNRKRGFWKLNINKNGVKNRGEACILGWNRIQTWNMRSTSADLHQFASRNLWYVLLSTSDGPHVQEKLVMNTRN